MLRLGLAATLFASALAQSQTIDDDATKDTTTEVQTTTTTAAAATTTTPAMPRELPKMAGQVACKYHIDSSEDEQGGTESFAIWDMPGERMFEFQRSVDEKNPENSFEVYQIQTKECLYSVYKDDGKYKCDTLAASEIFMPTVYEGSVWVKDFKLKDGTEAQLWEDAAEEDASIITNYTIVNGGAPGWYIKDISSEGWSQHFTDVKLGPTSDSFFVPKPIWNCPATCEHESMTEEDMQAAIDNQMYEPLEGSQLGEDLDSEGFESSTHHLGGHQQAF